MEKKNVFLCGVLLLFISISGCENTNKPIDLSNDDYYLFIEWQSVTSSNTKEGDEYLYNKFSSSEPRPAYHYDEDNRTLKISSAYYTTLNSSKKIIIGYNKQLDTDSFKVEQKYLNQLVLNSTDEINRFSFYDDITNIPSIYSKFKLSECTDLGKITMSFDPNRIGVIMVNETFYSLSSSFMFENDIMTFLDENSTIKNHGFIKKSDISYY